MNFVCTLQKATAFILLLSLLASSNFTFALSNSLGATLDANNANQETLHNTFAEERDIQDTKLDVTVDENITFSTQKSSASEVVSLGIIQDKTGIIDILHENESTVVLGNQEVSSPQVFTSKSVPLNPEAEPIDFSSIDLSTSLISTGDTKTLYGQENITIEIPDGDSREEYTPPIPGTDEWNLLTTSEDSGILQNQTQSATSTTTQNIYNCRVYEGYTCTYNLAAASIRQYSIANPNIASVDVGSTSFTVTGQSPGSTTLTVNYAGRTIATVYITVERMIVPIGANYGTNTLEVGQATYLVIRSGNGGYTVTSSNPLVVFVTGNGTNWTLSGMNPGTATITYRDSAGFFGTINMTVTPPPRNLSVSVGQTTLEAGLNTNLSITDGNGGYTVTSSNPSVLSVSGNGTNWNLSARSVGSSIVTVRDSRGKELTISYTVIDPSPLKTLRVSYNNAILRIGGVSAISILDGNGGYSLTSSNPSVLSVEGQGAYWIATARSGGSAIITVQDQRGMTAKLSYEVHRKIEGTLSSTSLFFGRTATLTITDGNGGYTVTSDNPGVATVHRTTQGIDTIYTVTPVAIGGTTLTIRDSAGEEGWVRVTTRGDVKPLTLSTQNIVVNAGADAYFSVTSGNGEYVHTMSNGNVEWSSVDPSIPSYRIRGVSPGYTILQITDSAGKVVQVRVDVVAQPKVASIANLEFSPSIQDEGMGGIYFEVEGNYREAGIEYHYGDRLQPIVEKLVLQDDHAYATLYSLECTDKTTCKVHLKPYVIDTYGNKIYHTNYDGTNYIVVGYDLSGVGLMSVSGDTESVSGDAATNGVITDSIKAAWKQIDSTITSIKDNTRGLYDGTADAINEQIDALKSLLDWHTYVELTKELKRIAIKAVNGEYILKEQLQKIQNQFGDLYILINRAIGYLPYLTSYQKQYYSSYTSVSLVGFYISPGKIKVTGIIEKIIAKVKKAIVDALAIKKLILISKFSVITKADDITNVAKQVRITETIGQGGGAILIDGSKEIADSIQTTLSKGAWTSKVVQGSGGPVTIYEKGTEKVTFRGFDTSSTNGSYPGWKHEQTMEVFTNVTNGSIPIKTEIKFILPE